MATNYQRGRAFEYRTRDKLMDRGAVYVMRAAQSKGIADLIALWPESWLEALIGQKTDGGLLDGFYRVPAPPWLVQCKRDGKLPKAEREELLRIASQTGGIAVLARIPKSGRGVEFVNLLTKEVM